MASVTERAEEAMRKGEVTKEACPSKAAVLKKIKDGQADAMSVGQPVRFGEAVVMDHYAVRFNDVELGKLVREMVMEGFGLS